MKYLEKLVADNGHKLVSFGKIKSGKKYMRVFDYSVKYGGAYDSHKFYNNYFVEVGNEA